jgi:N-acetylneuraminic acid mutarotase
VAREAALRTDRGSVTLAGGLLVGDRTTNRVLKVDLATGRTRPLPPLSVPVHDTAAGFVNGSPTVAGGGNTSEQRAIQSLTGSGWRHVGNLPTTRSDLSIVEWRQHAYVIGGYDGASEPTTVLRISSDGDPRPAGTLIHGVRYAATARIGSHVFVIGGEVAGRELDSIQRIDLASGRVQPAGQLPVPLGHATAAAVGGRILVLGGRMTPARQTDVMWWFDPGTRRCHPAGHLPAPLSDAAVISAGHRIWLLGGETPAITDAVVAVTLR